MFDRGIITITLKDYKESTPYQRLSWGVITDEIIRFRSNQKPFTIY